MRRGGRRFAVVLALLLPAVGCRSPQVTPPTLPPDDPELLAVLATTARETLATTEAPAVALAVVHGGRRAAGAWGLADVEANVAAGPATRFPIGSISKQLTAATVVKLAEAGLVDVAAPLGRYLPEAPAAFAAIPLQDLLWQTSGVPEFVTDPAWQGMDFSDPATVGPERRLAFVLAREPLFPAGTRWAYSNANYALLAEVVARAAGSPFDEVLAGRVLAPAGVVGIAPCRFDGPAAGEAVGYAAGEQGRVAVAPRNPHMFVGDGGLCATASGLVDWARALAGGRVATPAWQERMLSPAPLADGVPWPYGYGVSLVPREGRRAESHTGSMPGASAALFHFPDDDLTVAVLANLASDDLAERVAARLTRHLLGLPEPDVEDRVLTEAELEAWPGSWDLGPLRARVVREGSGLELVVEARDGEPPAVYARDRLRLQRDGWLLAAGDPEVLAIRRLGPYGRRVAVTFAGILWQGVREGDAEAAPAAGGGRGSERR